MSQTEQILNDLKKGITITPMVALHRYGCMRLAARVIELKHSGHKIKKTMINNNGKRYAGYYL
jgi:hypothetical protein